jgi:hypothetical protein
MIRTLITAGSLLPALLLFFISCSDQKEVRDMKMELTEQIQQQAVTKIVEKFGEEYRTRIETGVRQVAERWRQDDGTQAEFESFCLENFYTDAQDLTAVFERFQTNLESLYGNLHRINRQFNWMLHVEAGPVIPLDYAFAGYDVYAHIGEDLFKNRIAFTALLNFPIHSLEEKTTRGDTWTRRAWAEARLADEFINRVPADVNQARAEAYTLADDYIANYNIFMHTLVDGEGKRLFPEDLRLISHWGLRDELKAQYANPDGLAAQRMIQKVMERIVAQEIPAIAVDKKEADWNPFTNEIREPGTGASLAATPEANNRYKHLWSVFEGEKGIDPYTPATPSLIDRRFNTHREILERDVEALLHQVMTAPVLTDIASLIEKRLGRDLEPFDIWYNGFRPRGRYTEEELDRIVGQRFPSVQEFQMQLPWILRQLGFTTTTADYLAERIQVDPSRGAGHAWGARMKNDKSHLRTRIPDTGMNYKGYNIAIHELGHNVEQVFSLEGVEYYTLNGVPNTAFTEAMAFVFQNRDLNILGLASPDAQDEALKTLNDMWMTYEIAGVSLVDMRIWRWMYDNPNAGPDGLRSATVQIAKDVWNEYFAPVFGIQDVTLLAIYSHIISNGLYIPDYTIGHIIAFQIEDYLRDKNIATEIERMCRIGRLAPQVWMQQAVGSTISAEAMIRAAEESIGIINY